MSKREGPSGNEATQGKLRNREKLAQIQRKADVASIMATPAGRRFMWRLLFECCGLMSLFPDQDTGIFRHEGARGVGFHLAVELQEEHAEQYVQMIIEHTRDAANDKKIRDAALVPENEDG